MLDFWERFLDSLRALSAKGQRTVYRLTLVKAWNVEEMENYAELVQLGEPDFIEIKGKRLHCWSFCLKSTYCTFNVFPF